MSFEESGARALADVPCRYGTSRLLVRGPRRSLRKPYIAFLGSSDTYGSFVSQPFAALAESALNRTCVNLGCANAGVDALLNDPEIIEIAASAQQVVLQISGAQNISNALYRVHPRRNDRFLWASPTLCRIFPEVDFTDFHFNKHMLGTLHELSPGRFRTVREEVQKVWLARMRLLLGKIGTPTLLLWMRHDPECAEPSPSGLGADPLMVTRAMLDDLGQDAGGLVEVPVRNAGLADDIDGMVYGSLQAPAAENALGPRTHAEIANHVVEWLRDQD